MIFIVIHFSSKYVHLGPGEENVLEGNSPAPKKR